MIWSTFKKLYRLINNKEKYKLFIFFLHIILSAIFELLSLGLIVPAIGTLISPTFLKDFYNENLILNFLEDLTQNQIILMGIIFIVLIYLIKALFLTYSIYWQSNFGRDFHIYISKKLYSKYLSQTYSFHLNSNSSNLIRNINIEASSIYSSLMSSMMLFMELIVVFCIAFVLIKIESLVSTLVIFISILIGVFFSFFSKTKILVWGQKKVYHQGKSIKAVMEGLAGVKIVKLLGKQKEFYDKFSCHINKFADYERLHVIVNQLPRIWLEFSAILFLNLIIISISIEGKSFQLILPTLALFTGAAFRIIPSLSKILNSIQVLNFNKTSIEIIYNDIFLDNQKEDITILTKSNINVKNISCEKIYFSFQENDSLILSNLNFKINKGESLGIIGESGSGKSTIVNILLGLLEPNSGKILVNNKNIFGSKKYLRSWQNSIGYVPQDIFLFDDTIANNVIFGFDEKSINKDALDMALKNAKVDKFIESLPMGINTIVGERGVKLSGGQVQRIGIARALYRNPSILIFDEATSSLDYDTENSIVESINNLAGKTKIIVAHRLSTIKNCDRVIKINKGVIQMIGKLEDLD